MFRKVCTVYLCHPPTCVYQFHSLLDLENVEILMFSSDNKTSTSFPENINFWINSGYNYNVWNRITSWKTG